jgi:nitrate/TMAO reductase-like tetraheme cytochrome c subunit
MKKRFETTGRQIPKFVSVVLGICLLILVIAASLVKPASAAPPFDVASNDYCLGCHSQPGLTKTLPSGETLSLTIDPALFSASVHGEEQKACVDCHTNITSFPHPDFKAQNLREVTLSLYTTCKQCHEDQYNKILDSVHQKALAAGNNNAAVCTDCHNPHQQTRITDPKTKQILPAARRRIPEVCARCHSAIYDQYKNSVHGTALTEGNPDVPTCIDCHGVHNIQNPTTASFRNSTPFLCAKCHTDPKIMDKYDISTQVLNTYVADFHGTTVKLFDETYPDQPTNKPVCTDCHGTHDIVKVTDPKAGIALRENLLTKCQRCHPNANANFSSAWMSHYIPSPKEYPIVYYVNLFYKFFIPTVLGGMTLFVLTDIYRRILNRVKAGRRK